VKHNMANFIHIQRSWRLAAMVVLLVAGMAAVFATSTSWSSQTQQGANMKAGFVFIFRQGQKTLSEDEQKRRTEEVRAWALQQIKDGRWLEPRVLGDQSIRLGDSDGAASDGSVIALNFIQATDFDEAVNIAKTHPGLRYGVSIEVRPWTDPRAASAQRQ
jgi:hypothetical protein